ncbi:metallophosphoesterase family protein [Baekduia sp. Peel2402]|uniref:metallophosphoesterase family protein n=1 Tax=Baekduia sp. Peel2402 TaxID=3458296 RepID=UPI00403EAF11
MPDAPPLRIAAAGDMHCQPSRAEEAREAFAALAGDADLLLLAGDLTTHGQPEQARVLADACRDLDIPIYAVWGNHDWHCDQVDAIQPILEDAGITVLERETAIVCVNDVEIGLVGLKGFVGGFPGSHLPDFGEPLLRTVYAETTKDVEALDDGLKAIAHCPFRIVLMHYAPSTTTLVGEPETIWTMLGNDRVAAPIAQHEPDMVLHGHAHAGTFEGAIGDVPVYNVSVPVLGKDFWVFELSGLERATAPLH